MLGTVTRGAQFAFDMQPAVEFLGREPSLFPILAQEVCVFILQTQFDFLGAARAQRRERQVSLDQPDPRDEQERHDSPLRASTRRWCVSSAAFGPA